MDKLHIPGEIKGAFIDDITHSIVDLLVCNKGATCVAPIAEYKLNYDNINMIIEYHQYCSKVEVTEKHHLGRRNPKLHKEFGYAEFVELFDEWVKWYTSDNRNRQSFLVYAEGGII